MSAPGINQFFATKLAMTNSVHNIASYKYTAILAKDPHNFSNFSLFVMWCNLERRRGGDVVMKLICYLVLSVNGIKT